MIPTTDLRCPCTEKCEVTGERGGYRCANPACCHHHDDHLFPIVDGCPVLISATRCDTLCDPARVRSYVKRGSTKRTRVKQALVGVSGTTVANCKRFIDELLAMTDAPRVLVIGSGEPGSGTDALFTEERIAITGVDIYKSTSTDIVCDGHYLPFAANTFDGVWIQAVLEHVVEPQVVVGEIHRVLRGDGVVYAETPFMQQVHEGAFDYTRFTVLGHRYLFRDFTAVDFGGNKGAELVLAWSIRYFVWGLTRSRLCARAFGVGSAILLRPFARLLAARSLFDSSSGVYFLGRKSNVRIKHRDLPALYRGMFATVE